VAISRLARGAVSAAAIVREYSGLPGDHAEELQQAHERGARHLLQLCFGNGGSYIKLAQHIGTLVRP
jgi:predicted unusual protein kinase regulating ubiquinone biosynthesis (AarF/ABC1/UbiB family)